MTSKIEQLVTDLSALTVLEAAELSKMLEEKWGVSAAAPVAMAAAPGAVASAEEKTEFSVVLKAAGEKKIEVIKVIREVLPNLNLTEAKGFVDSAPKAVKEGISKDEAQQIKAKLEAAGAQVEIQ